MPNISFSQLANSSERLQQCELPYSSVVRIKALLSLACNGGALSGQVNRNLLLLSTEPKLGGVQKSHSHQTLPKTTKPVRNPMQLILTPLIICFVFCSFPRRKLWTQSWCFPLSFLFLQKAVGVLTFITKWLWVFGFYFCSFDS